MLQQGEHHVLGALVFLRPGPSPLVAGGLQVVVPQGHLHGHGCGHSRETETSAGSKRSWLPPATGGGRGEVRS